MACSFIISFLLLVAIATTAQARLGSQIYSTGIPNSIKELLKPVLNHNGQCAKNVVYHDLTFPLRYNDHKSLIYHDLTFPLVYYAHKRSDAAVPIALQIFKSNLSFFLEKDLFSGNPLKVMLDSTGVLPECAYLPRHAADSIPFSSAHLDQILSLFSIEPKSADATAMKDTLELCEWPALRGEGKACTTSLEEMEELAVEKLGEGAKPLVTKMEADSTESRTYEVKRVELKSKNYMSCHRLSYPYAVHYCHKMPATLVYEVSLLRDDGVDGESLVVCHRDTSDWDSDFFAFERLNVKPGKETICHLYPKGHLLWIAGNEAVIEQVI